MSKVTESPKGPKKTNQIYYGTIKASKNNKTKNSKNNDGTKKKKKQNRRIRRKKVKDETGSEKAKEFGVLTFYITQIQL